MSYRKVEMSDSSGNVIRRDTSCATDYEARVLYKKWIAECKGVHGQIAKRHNDAVGLIYITVFEDNYAVKLIFY